MTRIYARIFEILAAVRAGIAVAVAVAIAVAITIAITIARYAAVEAFEVFVRARIEVFAITATVSLAARDPQHAKDASERISSMR